MRFYVCDIKTGNVIDEYPMEVTSELSTRLKTYGSGELALLINHEACPRTWREDFVPWRILVLVCDDQDRIMWGGVPNTRGTTQEDRVTFPMVTLEKYFDRRYMPSAEYEQQDQTSVIARAMAEVCGDDLIGVGLDYDTPASGVLRDRSYYNDEDARILTRIQQLSNVINGFEWTIALEWADSDRARVRKIFRTGYPTLGYVTEEPELTSPSGAMARPRHTSRPSATVRARTSRTPSRTSTRIGRPQGGPGSRSGRPGRASLKTPRWISTPKVCGSRTSVGSR